MKKQIVKAEIIMILKCVVVGYSNRSCDGFNDLLPKMFPENDIAQKFKRGRQKSMYFATY